jgi:hypothetical protein
LPGRTVTYRRREVLVDIAIIGTGNMARGIATGALAGGHSVTLLGTESDKAQALADELSGEVSAGEVGDALTGDVVVLAIWYAAADDVLGRYGDQLDGKVVVDVMNPIDVDASRRSTWRPGRRDRRSPPRHLTPRSSRPSTPPSPRRSARAEWPDSRSTSSLRRMPRMRRRP